MTLKKVRDIVRWLSAEEHDVKGNRNTKNVSFCGFLYVLPRPSDTENQTWSTGIS